MAKLAPAQQDDLSKLAAVSKKNQSFIVQKLSESALDEPLLPDYDDKMREMLEFIRKSAEDYKVSSMLHLNPMFRHL